jgi:hypothetical protein
MSLPMRKDGKKNTTLDVVVFLIKLGELQAKKS